MRAQFKERLTIKCKKTEKKERVLVYWMVSTSVSIIPFYLNIADKNEQ